MEYRELVSTNIIMFFIYFWFIQCERYNIII